MASTALPRASLVAALLMLNHKLCSALDIWPTSSAEIIRLTGAGKSQAYESLAQLQAAVEVLDRPPGRPPSPPSQEPQEKALGWRILEVTHDYVTGHAGSITGEGARCTYSDGYRQFVLSLLDPGQLAEGMSLKDLASYIRVPLGTVKGWTRILPLVSQPSEGTQQPPLDLECIRTTNLQLIARLWTSWKGTFRSFCHMLRTEERLRYGDTFVGNFLQGIGLRSRRKHRPEEAPWNSDTFRSYFPGAQWLGDGKGITFCWGPQTYVFNLEAIFDPAVGSVVGVSVTDAEDESAVGAAYKDAIATTGSPPMAVSFDNRPCNHSVRTRRAIGALVGGALQVPVQRAVRIAYTASFVAAGLSLCIPEALTGTLLLRSTPGRGQAKAPLEGAFGLFEQALPDLEVSVGTPRDMARQALTLILTAWFRGRNGRPRKRLGNRSPSQAYHQDRPTQEEISEARAAFHELLRREEKARATRDARRDPVRLELLARGLADLQIPDPDGHLCRRLAYYARDAIVRGLATFEAKQKLGTLPSNADRGRYLGGIIRNLHGHLELEFISAYLLRQRIRLHDISLRPLLRTADSLRAQETPATLPRAFIDRALAATWMVDFRFWSDAASSALATLNLPQRKALYRPLCQKIVSFR